MDDTSKVWAIQPYVPQGGSHALLFRAFGEDNKGLYIKHANLDRRSRDLMVIISEDVTENTSCTEKSPLPLIEKWQDHCSFRVEKSLAVVRVRNFHGITFKLVQAPEMVRNLKSFRSSSVRLIKHIARTRILKKDHVITARLGGIQPYIPKTLEGDYHHERLLDSLYRVLKLELSRYVSELKYCTSMVASTRNSKEVIDVAPISSFKIPEDIQNDEQLSSQRKRVPATVLGERLVSFNIPQHFAIDEKEVNNLLGNKSGCLYTFSERLYGWKFERRQRINGRFDLYYHHLRSRKVFRSTIEVINFLLYESCRDKPQSASKGKIEEASNDSSAKNSGEKMEESFKRKRWSCLDVDSRRKLKQKIVYEIEDSPVESDVEKFLRESRENLNLSSMANPSRVYETEYYELSEEERREKVEKFLQESYNNMGKATYFSKEEAETTSQGKDEDEKHGFSVSSPRIEKEEAQRKDNTSLIEEEGDEETATDLESETETEENEGGKKQDDLGLEEGENSKLAKSDLEVDEAFVEIEQNPIRENLMAAPSSLYYSSYSFDEYDPIYDDPHSHHLMDL